MVYYLYATMPYSNAGLENYLAFRNGKTSLGKKGKEAINLVVSQVNQCRCIATIISGHGWFCSSRTGIAPNPY